MSKEYRHNPDAFNFQFRANPALTAKIKALATQRKRSVADTIRMLVYLGLNEHETNAAAGVTTGRQRQEQAAVARAQAEAAQRRREAEKARKQGKSGTVPAATPMLTPTLIDDARAAAQASANNMANLEGAKQK